MGALFSHTDKRSKHDPVVGSSINIHGHSYRIQNFLGKGGFGAVYAAKASDGKEVAIKTININEVPEHLADAFVQSYLNEVTLLSQLRKETRHVVVIYDFSFDERTGVGYIIMERGYETLHTLIEKLKEINHGPDPGIDSVMVKEFWRQMVSIIRTLHNHKIVHMDLKPDNLILFGETLKIADLGLSRRADVAGTGGAGTWYFSAPEVMQDTPGVSRYYGPKADIWSMGAILYYMVYGVPPQYHNFAANPPNGMRPHPDPALVDMLRRTLVKNPHQRLDIRQVMAHPYTQT